MLYKQNKQKTPSFPIARHQLAIHDNNEKSKDERDLDFHMQQTYSIWDAKEGML
jgi:hypothetical protein